MILSASGFWTLGLLDTRALGHLSTWALKHLGSWELGLLDTRALGLWELGHLGIFREMLKVPSFNGQLKKNRAV
jgi:hypothetical protein